jgi:hypothetical protein
MKGALAVLAAALAGGMSADSLAATAHTFVSGQKRQMIYEAAAGEANRLVVQVSTTSRLVRFSDQGATISSGSGCMSVSANTVDCRIAQRVLLVQVQLGDLADKADATISVEFYTGIDELPPGITARRLQLLKSAAPRITRVALLSIGDGHGMQGDGEVTGTALETSLRGTFEVHVRKGQRLRWPRAETPTHYISMGLHEDLDEAARLATREMVEFLVAEKGLSRDDAYVLCALAADLHVTQAVDQTKGVHVTVAKSIFK